MFYNITLSCDVTTSRNSMVGRALWRHRGRQRRRISWRIGALPGKTTARQRKAAREATPSTSPLPPRTHAPHHLLPLLHLHILLGLRGQGISYTQVWTGHTHYICGFVARAGHGHTPHPHCHTGGGTSDVPTHLDTHTPAHIPPTAPRTPPPTPATTHCAPCTYHHHTFLPPHTYCHTRGGRRPITTCHHTAPHHTGPPPPHLPTCHFITFHLPRATPAHGHIPATPLTHACLPQDTHTRTAPTPPLQDCRLPSHAFLTACLHLLPACTFTALCTTAHGMGLDCTPTHLLHWVAPTTAPAVSSLPAPWDCFCPHALRTATLPPPPHACRASASPVPLTFLTPVPCQPLCPFLSSVSPGLWLAALAYLATLMPACLTLPPALTLCLPASL